MNLDAYITEFYDAANCRGATFDVLLRFAQNVGFSDVTMNAVQLVDGQHQRTTDLQTSFSEDWRQELRSLSEDVVRSDPILNHMGARSDPIVWDQRTYDDKSLYGRFREVGIGSGIAAALPLPNSDLRLFVGFSRAEDSIADDPFLGTRVGALMLATSCATIAYKAPGSAALAPCPLTERELEVLRWVREGKSSWDISVILGISDGTIGSHVRNIGKKLGVSTRMQAVVHATREGWL